MADMSVIVRLPIEGRGLSAAGRGRKATVWL